MESEDNKKMTFFIQTQKQKLLSMKVSISKCNPLTESSYLKLLK